MGAIHRKVRERRKDLLHQISHRLTAKAGVLKVEMLNVRGMGAQPASCLVRGRCRDGTAGHALRLQGGLAATADHPVRSVVPVQSDLLLCGALHREMRKLSVRTLRCVMSAGSTDRDRNAAANVYWYPEERDNRIGNDATRMEMGNQEARSGARR